MRCFTLLDLQSPKWRRSADKENSPSRCTASRYVLGRAQWTFDAECQKFLCVTFVKSNKNLRYARFTRNKNLSRKGKTQEVGFIVRSVSATLGEGCFTHNDRSFTADNVDGSRTHPEYCLLQRADKVGHPQAHRQRSGDFKAMEESHCGKV